MLIIQSNIHLPSFNLAAEEFLLSQRQDEILFLYVNAPSVVIGSNQAIRNEVDLDFCTENNIQVIRRMSGGGAVFHDEGNLNFCFIHNKSDVKSSLNADFLQPIVDVLTDLGIPVTIGKRKDLWLQNNYKITGTASHIAKNRELHHGTLLYDSNLVMLDKALNANTIDNHVKAIASVRSTVKNIRTYFEEQSQFTLNTSDFMTFFIRKLAVFFQQEEIVCFSDIEIDIIQQLADNKYKTKEWIYKK